MSAPPPTSGPIYAPPARAVAPSPATADGGPTGGGPTGGAPYDSSAPYDNANPNDGANLNDPANRDKTGDPYAYAPLPTAWPPATADPYAPPAPRIEPSPPPPPRTRLLTGTLIGLIIGLLIFGAAGWYVGRTAAPKAAPPKAATPKAATPKPQQTTTNPAGIFEQSQAALNKRFFAGTKLTPIAQGWLPYLSTCGRSGNPGGPKLGAGEKARVRCTIDGMSAIFVEYRSTAERDRARARTLDQSGDAQRLTPGAARPAAKAAPSGRTTGNYAEYAYELTEGGVTRTVAAIWWDDAQTPIAAYLLAYWKDGLGERWEPVRDLWSRYA